MHTIWVSLGCCNKLNYPRPGGLYDKLLFLTVVETEGLRSSFLADLVSGENWFAVDTHTVEKGIISLLCPHIRPLIPFRRAPPSSPNYPLKAPPPNTSHWRLEFQCQHVNLRGTGDTNIQSIAGIFIVYLNVNTIWSERLSIHLVPGSYYW